MAFDSDGVPSLAGLLDQLERASGVHDAETSLVAVQASHYLVVLNTLKKHTRLVKTR